jgi:hypothetical protein
MVKCYVARRSRRASFSEARYSVRLEPARRRQAERWETPDGETIVADLDPGIVGGCGPNLHRLVLARGTMRSTVAGALGGRDKSSNAAPPPRCAGAEKRP